MRKALVLLMAALALSACGPRVIGADVTRFHSPELLAPQNQTFTIVPAEGQIGSLEFQRYAEMVAQRLAARGLRPVGPGEGQADLVVQLSYGVSGPRQQIETRPVTASVGFGAWHDPWHWGFGAPLFYDEVYTRTVYTRQLQMRILDGDAWRRNVAEELFEGRAVSVGTSSALPEVMPYLMTALFENFPGESGRTVHVRVPIEGT